MKEKFSDTAILFFSREMEQEARVKELATRHNRHVCQTLIRSSLQTAHASHLPVITCYQQSGNSFGERFVNALEQAFAQGYQYVIAIGNDSPLLTSQILSTTASLLRENDLVVGPSTDGGVYLIGIARHTFQRNVFLNFPWQTERVQDEFRNWTVSSQLRSCWLSALADLDTAEDLLMFLKMSPGHKVARWIRAVITQEKQTGSTHTIHPKNCMPPGTHTLRAPPLVR